MKKDFVSLLDLEQNQLEELFALADKLKSEPFIKPLAGKTAALIFQKPSLRTRVSFEVGVYQLGGHPIYLGQEAIGIGKRESVADVARVLSRYNDVIVARLFEHNLLMEFAKWATIPVINALTNFSHPCQVLADAYTIRQHGKLQPNVKVVFVGDGNNVVNSWLEFSTLFPIHFVLSTPKGFEPNQKLWKYAATYGMSKLEIVENPKEAVKQADVIYTDVWTSMGQEDEEEKRKKIFTPYQVNEKLLSYAKPNSIVMHCLPANRGEEITDEVMDGHHSVVFDEAENRLHIQKAILTMLCDSQNDHLQTQSQTLKSKRKSVRW